MTTRSITIEIPAHLAEAAQARPESLKRDLAISWYNQERLSLEQASELAGVEVGIFENLVSDSLSRIGQSAEADKRFWA